jgi:hypothetical protein
MLYRKKNSDDHSVWPALALDAPACSPSSILIGHPITSWANAGLPADSTAQTAITIFIANPP